MIESDMAYKPLNGVIRWFKAWTAPFVGGVRGYWSDARTLGSQCGAGCLGFLSRADDSFKRLSEQGGPPPQAETSQLILSLPRGLRGRRQSRR